MIDALSIASSGLSANQAWIDSISNNVANMQTIGYKRSQVNFHDRVRDVGTRDDGGGMTENLLSGAGIQASAPMQVFSPGAVRQTGNELDLAIQGDGFFEVELPTGELAYSRAGRFHLNTDGQLAMSTGQVLTADLRLPPMHRFLDVCLSVQQDRDLAASIHSVLPLPAPVIIDEDSDEKLLKTDDPLDLSDFADESEEEALARAIAEEQETDA